MIQTMKLHGQGSGPGDDSDNLSWESLSSGELSLEDDHPLLAFEAEVTQAVLQGFIEFRKKHTSEDSEV